MTPMKTMDGNWALVGLPGGYVVIEMFLIDTLGTLQGMLSTGTISGSPETWIIVGQSDARRVHLSFTPSTGIGEGFTFEGPRDDDNLVVSGKLAGAFQGDAKLLSTALTAQRPALNGSMVISGLPADWLPITFVLAQMGTYLTGMLVLVTERGGEILSVAGNNFYPDIKLVFTGDTPELSFSFTGRFDRTNEISGTLGDALSGAAVITSQPR